MPDEREPQTPPEREERDEPDEQPERREDHKERDQWERPMKETLKVSQETLQRTNQALDLQARRMNDLASLHESHMRQWEETLEQTRELMKAARESQASADQARSELVSVTAALVKISQVQQQMLKALADEQ